MEQMTVRKRRVVKLGKSLYSVLPYEFARKHRIKPGDPIAITLGEEVLKVIPFGDRTGDREGGY